MLVLHLREFDVIDRLERSAQERAPIGNGF